MSEVFEEPVPPKIPTVSPDFICRLISDKANFSASFEYLKLTFSKDTEPSFTSVKPFSGLTRSDLHSSTSVIRFADSTDMVNITIIIAAIISEERICTP